MSGEFTLRPDADEICARCGLYVYTCQYCMEARDA